MNRKTAKSILIPAIFIMIFLAVSTQAVPIMQIDPVTLDPDRETASQGSLQSEDNGSNPGHSFSLIMSDVDQDGKYDTFVIREDNRRVSNESFAEDQSFDRSSKVSSKTYIIAKYKKSKVQCFALWSKWNCINKIEEPSSIRVEFIRTVVKNWAIYAAKSWIKVNKAVSLIMSF